MFSVLLVLLGFNSAALFIVPGLAGVFYGTAAQNFFNTLGVFVVFFELMLPFTLLGAWFKRPRFTPARPRYRPEPVGDFRGLDAATLRHLEAALRGRAAPCAFPPEGDRRESQPIRHLPAPGHATSRTIFNGDEVEEWSDGTWYLPRLRLHVEADGTTWKEL